MNGTLGGLVSTTGACGIVEHWTAVIIGFFAGIFYFSVSMLLVRIWMDDVVDAVPIHMTNGIWGMIAVGLFANSDRVSHIDIRGSSRHWCFHGGQWHFAWLSVGVGVVRY